MPRPARYALLLLGSLALLLWVAPRTSIFTRALLPDMVQGTAYRPYVKRTLVAIVVRAVDAATPAALDDGLARFVAAHPRLARLTGWKPEHANWYVAVFAVHWLSLFGFALAFRALAASLIELKPAAADLAALGALCFVPIHFGYQNFVYDFPNLALWTAGLLPLVRRNRPAYYLLLPLGLLNKETFVLMIVLFWIYESRRLGRGVLMRHLALQVVLATAILGAVGIAYRHQPGGEVEWHLARNMHYVPKPKQLLHDLVYWSFVAWGLLWLREKRALATLAFSVAGPLLLIAVFIGFFGEYRAFYDAYPLLAVMALHTTIRFLRHRPVRWGAWLGIRMTAA